MGHFYFVRHGQTIWNVENKICGATDIALTEFGHQQAIETGRKILAEGIKADEILYSPLIRAADTARHISEITGILARVEPRLTEQRFGKWEATARNGEAFKKAKECFACSHTDKAAVYKIFFRYFKCHCECKNGRKCRYHLYNHHITPVRIIPNETPAAIAAALTNASSAFAPPAT